MHLYARRLLVHRVVIALSFAATAFGLLWLVLVLGSLLYDGISAIRPSLFTELTPPPGSSSRRRGAIWARRSCQRETRICSSIWMGNKRASAARPRLFAN